MNVELDVNVVNAAMGCIQELNAKTGNSMEKSAALINIYNLLSSAVNVAKNKLAEEQKADKESSE